jgi:hypothetical protein
LIGGHVVGIDQATAERLEVVVAGEVVEQCTKRGVTGIEALQELGELRCLGVSHRRQGIERGQHQALLILGQLDKSDRHAPLFTGQGEFDPQVAIDDVARRPIYGHFGNPAHLCQGSRQRCLLVSRMGPPVARVRDQVRRCGVAVADDPAAPGRRSLNLRHAESSAANSRRRVRLTRMKSAGG